MKLSGSKKTTGQQRLVAKLRRPLQAVAAGILLGGTIGTTVAGIEIAANRFIPYRLYRLTLIVLRDNLNENIALFAGGFFLLCLLGAFLWKRRGGQPLAAALAAIGGGLLLAKVLLGTFTIYPLSSIPGLLWSRLGGLSLDYLLAVAGKRPAAFGILAGTLLLLPVLARGAAKAAAIIPTLLDARWIRRGAALSIFLALSVNLGTVGYELSRPPAGPNVVLIVIDSLRADHLGCYGYDRDVSPGIDKLARDSYLFADATAAAPWTSPSCAALLTGQDPASLGFLRDGNIRVADQFVFLAEIFRNAGYRTGGIVSYTNVSAQLGFSQGFEVYDQEDALGHQHVSSPSLSAKAATFLAADEDRPFFLFLHYFDPHYNYIEHEDYRFDPDYRGEVKSGSWIKELREAAPGFTPDDVAHLVAIYDSEIAFTDKWLAEVIELLRERGLYNDSLLILTADHGEEFMERGDNWIGHTRTLYQEVIHVPFLLKPPGNVPGILRPEPVGLIDILPTILQVCGLNLPPDYSCAGKAIKLAAGPRPARSIFSSTRRKASLDMVRRGDWKLISETGTDYNRLFNLSEDKGESRDLSHAFPEKLHFLLDELASWRQRRKSPEEFGVKVREAEFTPEQQDQLKSLGYL